MLCIIMLRFVMQNVLGTLNLYEYINKKSLNILKTILVHFREILHLEN
jgi:hypothetical protein